MLSFRLGNISIKRFLLPIILVVIMAVGVNEAKGQYKKVHARYVTPPVNTDGYEGKRGSGGVGFPGVKGSFEILSPGNLNDEDYITTNATINAKSGTPGTGVGASDGEKSWASLNLTFNGLIKPVLGTRIFFKAKISSNSGGLVNSLFANALAQVSLEAFNGPASIGSTTLNTLDTNSLGEYIYKSPGNCTSIKITVTTDDGTIGLLGLLGGGPSTASAVIRDLYFYDPTCNVPTSTTTEIIGIGLLGTGITNPDNAIDGDFSTASKFNSGLLAAIITLKQKAYFSGLSSTGEVATVTVGIPKALLSVGVLSGVYITAYNGTTSVGSQSFSALLQGTDLLGLLQSGKIATVSLATSAPFDRVEVSMASLLNVATSLDLYEIQRTPAKPTFVAPASQQMAICSGSTATFTPQLPSAGNELRWYKTAIGGTPTYGNTYTTANLTAPDTVYVATGKIGCTGESERVTASVIINPLPATPAGTAAVICSGNNGVFQVTAPVASQTYKWHTAITGGTEIGNGATFTTATPLTGTVTYYLEAISAASCPSATRTPVTITVNPLPTAPVSPNVTICSGSTATLTVQSPNSGYTYKWYTVATGGTATPGQPYTTSALLSNTDYWVEAVDNATSCISPRTKVTVTINAITPGSIGSNQTICTGTSPALFTSVAATGTSLAYKWQRSSINNTSYADIPGATSETFKETLNLTNTTYYKRIVTSTLNGVPCISSSNEIIITIHPTTSLTSSLTSTICNNGLFTYTATTNIPTTSISWSRAAVTGISTAASSGTTNIINEPLSNTTSAPIDVAYVFTMISNGCTSTQTVTLKVFPLLKLSSTTSPGAICSNTLFSYTPTSDVAGTVLKWTRAFNPDISNAPVTTGVSGAINETLISTSSNPVVVTYIYTISVNGCTTTQGLVVTVNPSPSISISPVNVCENTNHVVLPYSNPSMGLTSYNITWSSAANALGFPNKINQTLNPSEISLDIPLNAPTGIYTANITVKSETDCISNNIGFVLNIFTKPGSPHLSIKIN